MIRRLVVLLAVCLAGGALSATATADPDSSPAFSYIQIPFELDNTDEDPNNDGYNPCLSEAENEGLVVDVLIETYMHSVDRGNGSHYNVNWWVSSEDSFGFVLPRTSVGPDVENVNVNNGVMTFSSIGNYNFVNPETKQRYQLKIHIQVTDVGGANVVAFGVLGFSDCLGPDANGV